MRHATVPIPAPALPSAPRWLRRLAVVAAAAIVAGSAIAISPVSTVTASATTVHAANFPAGDIISNAVMYDSKTMSATSIQSFLKSKGSGCKTTSSKFCLKSYKVTTANVAANSYCTAYKGAKNETAAAIISKMSTACGVNPEVLLVTLQKEHSLVTQAATKSTIDIAMSYGCSDASSCSAAFKGFFNQITTASQSFKRAVTYPVGTPTPISYGPGSTCGSQTVTIKNRATSRLYTYTPYVPDAAVLAGHTDSCAQFGNLNFWTIFNSWFSFSVIPDATESLVTAYYTDVLGRAPSVSDVYGKSKPLLTGTSTATVAKGFFSSTEGRTRYIDAEYASILHHAPSSSSLATDLKQLAKGSLKLDSIAPSLYAKATYFAAIGSTNTKFVTAVYESVLGHDPSPSALASQLAKVKKSGRSSFAKSVWTSTEHNGIRASDAYATYLPDAGTPTEKAALAASIAKNGYFTALSKLLASAEYGTRASSTYPIDD